mgnify:FL=1|tara:strand:+ start:105 stop:689 length:585 start_codon:yes stop_codon:yes gene_type:complete
MIKKQSKNELFLELAQPNDQGISKVISTNLFIEKYSRLKHGNGRDWGRTDDKNFHYNLKTKKNGNKIISYQCVGFKKTLSKEISPRIREFFKNKRCSVLGISKIEIDHKNGRYNDPRVANKLTQKTSDFQALSRSPNLSKREYCKECEKTNIRFDAKIIGYSKSYYSGGKNHNGTINGCVGCYWHDVLKFKENL